VTFGAVPVPGATVTATQGDKKFVAITDEMGAYSFPDLPDGMWSVEVEMLGFSGLKGDIATTTWELKMLPLEQIKTEVAHNDPPPAPAAAPAAAATTAANNSNNNNRANNNGRTPAAANGRQAFQQAQVNENTNAAPAQQAANTPAPSAFANASQEQLNQQASDASVINGTVNNGAASPFAQSGAFGNNRRGVRSLYNGNFALNNDNSALDARNYSLSGGETPQPAYNRATVSFNFGGPLKIPGIIKRNNGPNFFVGYQRTQNQNVGTSTGRMPTDLERQGDLSQTLTPLGTPLTIIDPQTGSPFSGNMILPDRISQQARELLKLFPRPNASNPRYNYQVPVVSSTHSDSLSSRMNKQINQKNNVFGNFDMQSSRNDNSNIFNFLDSGRTLGINTALNWTNRPTQRFQLSFRYQFSRNSSHTTPYFANHINVSQIAGVTGNNQDPVNWGPSSLNFSGGTSGLSDAGASSNRTATHTMSYSSFWNHGRHNIQFGADMRRQQINLLTQQDARGTFTFTGTATGLPAPPSAGTTTTQTTAIVPGTGSDLADFLLGIPDTSSIAFGNADKYYRQTFYDGFFSDDWRVNGSLTVNLGARWEYETPVSEKYSRLINLKITPGFSQVTPIQGNDFITSDAVGVQPRLAFAWRPIAASSVIVRGTYGVYRNTNVYQSIASQMAQQYPLSKTLSVQNTPTLTGSGGKSFPLSLANGFNSPPGAIPNTFAIDPNFRIGNVQNWSLQIQRDLPAALQMTAIYLGTKGTRLPQEFVPNTTPIGPIGPTGYVFLSSNGNSTREAGQIQVRRRLRSGFTASAQYTYAKALDDAPLMAGGQVATVNTGGASIAQDWTNLRAERGRSSFDQRHQGVFSAQYTSGSGLRGGGLLSGWKGTLFKEWLIAPSLTIGTGLPQNPVYVAALQGTGVTNNLRPDVTGASIHAAPKGLFLNPLAFTAPAPGHYGNAARNSITGPAQFAFNASAGRTFRLGDRYNMDVNINAINVLNRVTYQSWNTTITNAQFGLPAQVGGMRTVSTSMRLRF